MPTDPQSHPAASVVQEALSRLCHIEARFLELETEIRNAQPCKSGSVLLHLSRHRPVCMGCPHPVWKRWQAHPKSPVHRWRAHPIKNPLQRIPRGNNNPHLRHLIEETIALEGARRTIVKSLSAIEKSLRFNLPAPTKRS